MFVVDLLHEFELGMWKAIFTHLMRILFAAGGSAVQELNFRYVIVNFAIVQHFDDYIQVPSGSYFWQGNDQTVPQERFCNETSCSP
jgi:hypothetical protein